MKKIIITLGCFLILLSACQPASKPQANPPIPGVPTLPRVLAPETFLADIAQNVAGDRLKVESLIPVDMDPHAFEPTPKDVARIVDSQVLILNGMNLEAWLEPILNGLEPKPAEIIATSGLTSRQSREGEPNSDETKGSNGGDPHFWLDPNYVIHYIGNIRDGLIQADPAGKDTYTTNTERYILQLKELDAWIVEQVKQIPSERRLLVTNHESMGYFADRYSFKIVGAILPSVSTGASPSAQELAQLVDKIRSSGARAIFLETGSSSQLAEQVARETGIKLETGLRSHSITAPDGDAPTYIEMMRFNVNVIVAALK